MDRLPEMVVIGLMLSNRADEHLLAELLSQTGYVVELSPPGELMRGRPAASLFIVDEVAARQHGVALAAIKKQAQPLYLPMLLALAGPARPAPWLRAGFDDVLRLPLQKDDLLARLEAFLRLRLHSEAMQSESTRRFHATFDLAPVGIAHVDLAGRFLLTNRRFHDMLGYGAEELASLTIDALAHPDEGGSIRTTLHLLGQGQENAAARSDQRYCRKDGTVIWTSVAIAVVRDGDKRPQRLIAAIEDITARKQMEEAIRQSERFVTSTIDALSQHICVTDKDGRVLAVNRSWRQFAIANGAPAGTEWERSNYFSICAQAGDMGPQDVQAFSAGMRDVANGARDQFDMGYACQSLAEQRLFTVRVTRFPGDGAPRLVVAYENVTQTKRAENQLLYLARYDSLTGLPNRAFLHDRLRLEIAQANRYGHPVWVIFIDIDRFKQVNDTLGHGAGDRFLTMIAARLHPIIRETDTLARFGGDEFVMILSERSEAPLNTAVLNRIMAAVAEPVLVGGQVFYHSCSIGVAVYPGDGTETETLMAHADVAMHRAKEQGGNGYQFYAPEMNEAAMQRVRLEKQLRSALDRDEFVLHYQPQVDLRTGKIVGVEALIRWRHPELGMVAPDRFIGIAEETGFIVPIGAWVIRTACAQNKAWQLAGLGAVRMAVNLSARQFAQKDLVQSVQAILEETGLAPEYLDIELTETLVMSDVEETIGVLKAFKALGVKLSIDDFGTGYSSLAYLQRFPVDVLKIDRSFINDLTIPPDNGAIAKAIIGMAHSLGIEIIAEGVETEAQCALLCRNLCDEIQGFWFSRPVVADELAMLLRQHTSLPAHLVRGHRPERTLLLVDDEPNVISALKRSLRNEGYRILAANSGHEGLEILARHKVDVILSDQRMPGMTGVEFLRRTKEEFPETMRIVLSGYTELRSITDAINEGAIYRFLTKPWDDAQLRRHLAEAFAHKEMADENRRLNVAVQTANKELASNNRRLRDMVAGKPETGDAVGHPAPADQKPAPPPSSARCRDGGAERTIYPQ